MVLLHGLTRRKSQRTPKRDVDLTRKRQQELEDDA